MNLFNKINIWIKNYEFALKGEGVVFWEIRICLLVVNKTHDFLNCFMDIHKQISETNICSDVLCFSSFFYKFLLTSLAGAQDE